MHRLTRAIRRRPLAAGLLLGCLIWAALLLLQSCYPPHTRPLAEWQQVINCESSGNPHAISEAGTVGILQIDPGWLSGSGGTLWGNLDVILTGTDMTREEAVEWLANPTNSISAAREIQDATGGGWSQWECQPDG